jgi:hypothetical protein
MNTMRNTFFSSALVLTLATLPAAAQTAAPSDPAAAAAPIPTPADAPVSATATAPVAPAAPPVAAPVPPPELPNTNTTPLDPGDGGGAVHLDDDQPGATDSLLNGEALKLYGFGDVGYQHMLMPKNSPWFIYLNRHPSLFVGHLNFYFDSQLAERWRALAEVRFTYLPQGSWATGSDGVVRHHDSHGADYTDFTRDHPVNGLMIQRAFIEYSAFSWLSVQAGQFFTPYGIWNVDHGSPVIIGVNAPYIVGSRLLPDSQVGLLGYGRISLVDDLELSYALALSNGRTDLIAYEDLDDNKAITARLALTYRGLGELTVGSTFYAGTTTDNTRAVYFEGSSPKSREDVFYQVEERSFAFDLRWIKDDLHFQAEAVINDRKYTERGRPTLNGGLDPDRRNAGGYALVGYRTPLAGIMPYIKGEYSPDPALQAIGVDQNIALLTGGLNFRPVPRVVFKAEYNYGFFPDHKPGTFADNTVAGLNLQIAWAF